MAEVDARKATAPYNRQTKGRKDKDGGPAVIKMETFVTRVQNLIDLKIAAVQAVKAYQEASSAVAEASGLNAASVNKYVRARINNNFREERDRVSQLAFVFESLNELGEYTGPKEPDLLTNEPEQNPVQRAANDDPSDPDDDDEAGHPGNIAPSPAARAGGRSRGR